MTTTQTGILLFLILGLIPGTGIAAEKVPHAVAVTTPIKVKPFQPPEEKDIPDNQFGKMVKLGEKIFVQTKKYAGKYTGNEMQCVNCHLDAGRLANSAPLWAAWVRYPKYRGKNKMVNTMAERFQGCFRYSMNGTPPPADSKTLKALMSYSFWLASGAPTNVNLPGRGYPKIDKPSRSPDYVRGKKVFETNCAICHGTNGQGTQTNGQYIFPPLWGKTSFNWGAGMHRINTAASFIHANMPLGKGGTLTVQQAWDVAYYINSHERPQDPRFNGNVTQTDKKFHSHLCRYGDNFNHHVLGQK